MKKLAFVLALTVFAACSFTIIWLELRIQEQNQLRQEAARMEYALEEADLPLQRSLARWYNLNLSAQWKDPAFETSYWDILDTAGGAMGYLYIPRLAQKQWIYHGTDAAQDGGVGHIPMTALPTGGEGNHSALVGSFSLETGDYFYIHILGEVRPFQVKKTEFVMPMELSFSSQGEKELCTLVVPSPDGGRVQLIRGIYAPDAPREETIPAEKTEEDDGWVAAASAVVALGILLVPMCMWNRERCTL